MAVLDDKEKFSLDNEVEMLLNLHQPNENGLINRKVFDRWLRLVEQAGVVVHASTLDGNSDDYPRADAMKFFKALEEEVGPQLVTKLIRCMYFNSAEIQKKILGRMSTSSPEMLERVLSFAKQEVEKDESHRRFRALDQSKFTKPMMELWKLCCKRIIPNATRLQGYEVEEKCGRKIVTAVEPHSKAAGEMVTVGFHLVDGALIEMESPLGSFEWLQSVALKMNPPLLIDDIPSSGYAKSVTSDRVSFAYFFHAFKWDTPKKRRTSLVQSDSDDEGSQENCIDATGRSQDQIADCIQRLTLLFKAEVELDKFHKVMTLGRSFRKYESMFAEICKEPCFEDIPSYMEKEVLQNSDTLEGLYDDAQRTLASFTWIVEQVAEECNATNWRVGNLKGEERSYYKIFHDYNGDARRLLDVSRASIVCYSIKDIRAGISFLRNNLSKDEATVLRIKSMFQEKLSAIASNGYRHVLVSLDVSEPRGKKSHICEIQFHYNSMYIIKQDEGHQLYAWCRRWSLEGIMDPDVLLSGLSPQLLRIMAKDAKLGLNSEKSVKKKANWMGTIAQILRLCGEFSEAVEYAKQQLEVYEDAVHIPNLHARDSYIARTKNELGVAYMHNNEFEKALSYHMEALRWQHKNLGRHSATSKTYNDLGKVYLWTGKLKLSLQHHIKALQMKIELFGQNHPSTAMSKSDFGIVWYRLGNFDESCRCLMAAKDCCDEVLGPMHLQTAAASNDLGWLYYSMEKLEEAKTCFQDALFVRDSMLGADHPDTAKSHTNVAMTITKLGNYVDAQKHFTVAMRVHGDLHKNMKEVARIKNGEAIIAFKEQQYDKARELSFEAIEALAPNELEQDGEERRPTCPIPNIFLSTLDGIELQKRTVVKVCPGSEAEEKGLTPGWTMKNGGFVHPSLTETNTRTLAFAFERIGDLMCLDKFNPEAMRYWRKTLRIRYYLSPDHSETVALADRLYQLLVLKSEAIVSREEDPNLRIIHSDTFGIVAQLFIHRGRPEEAEICLKYAIEVLKSESDPASLGQVMVAWNMMGVLKYRICDYEAAYTGFLYALEHQMRVILPDAYKMIVAHKEEEKAPETIIYSIVAHFGSDKTLHLDNTWSEFLKNVSWLEYIEAEEARDEGREEDATIRFGRALEYFQMVLSMSHGVKALANVAVAHLELGHLDDAKRELTTALKMCEDASTPGLGVSSDIAVAARCMNGLGKIKMIRKEYDDALSYFRRASETLRLLAKSDNRTMAWSLEGEGDVIFHRAEQGMEEYLSAFPLWFEALRFRETICGATHRHTISTRQKIEKLLTLVMDRQPTHGLLEVLRSVTEKEDDNRRINNRSIDWPIPRFDYRRISGSQSVL